jgi:hypothetical protein
MAAASLVVSGLGSDAGIVDLDQTMEVLRRHASAEVAARICGPVLTAQAGGVPGSNSMIALTGLSPRKEPPTAQVALVPGMCAVTVDR